MDFQEVLDYLFSQLPMYQRDGKSAFKKDLHNISVLCDKLGNPHHAFKSVHIGGTNGKGSTAHMIAATLQVAGYKTGLYTSPHLKCFTERIKINGKNIPRTEVISFVEKNKALLDTVQPSFFEMTVAMAFYYFARQKVDIAVIEVGLGGRLDSTNIITPEIALITNIGHDHQNLLGNTKLMIAKEKAGIMKPHVPTVINEYQPEVAQVFKKQARLVKCPLFYGGEDYYIAKKEEDSNTFTLNIYHKDALFLEVSLGLTGHYQVKNLLGVLKLTELLNRKGFHILKEHIKKGLREVKSLTGIKGRWQILQESPLTICDTCHNKEGLQQAIAQIKKLKYKRLFFIMGVVKDKKTKEILKELPKIADYYFCQAHIPRAMPAEELAAQAALFKLRGTVIKDVNKAIEDAKAKASPNDLIFIGGSLFLVAEIADL